VGYVFLEFKFFRFIQSGLYFDFIIKKVVEIFIKNFLVYSALFFGEKYFIEFITKKIIEINLFNIGIYIY
jgi:hypothetical protein